MKPTVVEPLLPSIEQVLSSASSQTERYDPFPLQRSTVPGVVMDDNMVSFIRLKPRHMCLTFWLLKCELDDSGLPRRLRSYASHSYGMLRLSAQVQNDR